MIINASEYGIKPDKENGKELSVLFKKLSEIDTCSQREVFQWSPTGCINHTLGKDIFPQAVDQHRWTPARILEKEGEMGLFLSEYGSFF